MAVASCWKLEWLMNLRLVERTTRTRAYRRGTASCQQRTGSTVRLLIGTCRTCQGSMRRRPGSAEGPQACQRSTQSCRRGSACQLRPRSPRMTRNRKSGTGPNLMHTGDTRRHWYPQGSHRDRNQGLLPSTRRWIAGKHQRCRCSSGGTRHQRRWWRKCRRQ